MMKLAVIATHPIQYQAPLWRAIAASGKIEIKVFFATRHGLEPAFDPGFGKSFAWDIPLTEGYEHEFLPSIRVPFFKGPVGNRFPKGLSKKLSEGHFDAVLVNGYANAASLAGILAAWKVKVPVMMRGDTHEHSRPKSARQRMKRLVLPLLLRHIDGFIAVGTWNKEHWISYGAQIENVPTALFPIDNEFFNRKSGEQETIARSLRAKWGAPVEDSVFIYCAKLIPVKAPEVLLRAFSILAEPKAHLVFVGAGQMEPSLKKLQEELGSQNVHWEGFVNQSALPAYYRASDVLVLPSRFEPWGLVVNEAMACGTPCIVSDVVGAGADLVDGQDTGLVFPHDDVQALASALRTACDSAFRLRWKANLPHVLGNANFAKNVQAIEALLGRVKKRRTFQMAKTRS